MGVAPVPTIEKAQKTRRPARRTFMRALPHLVPCFIYFLYLVIGSWIFIWLEGDNAELEKYKAMVANMRAKLEQAIYNESLGITNGSNWNELLDNYTQLVTRPEWKLGRYENLQHGVVWSFSSSMLFCVITITTIGYGDIVPITGKGRIFVGIYAAFGIPLNVIFLADVGYLFAKLIVKIIRAIKLYKLRRRRAKEAARELKSGTPKKRSKFRRRRKYAKRGKKFKHRNKGRSKGAPPKGGLMASRGMSIHARSVMQRNVPDIESEQDTSFNKDNHSMAPNGGRDLSGPAVDVNTERPTFQKAKKPGAVRKHKGVKSKSGGLSASRNMSVHARSLRRRVPDDDDTRYAKRPRGKRGGQGVKRKAGHHGGGISASRHMSVHARSLMRHCPEDLDSEDTTSNDEPIKTVSEGIESVTKEILPNDIALTIPNSRSDVDLVGNEQLSHFDHFENETISNVGDQSISMASETTDKSSVVDDDNSVDTEVPTIIVLTILISYICIGAIMMMYVEGWDYGESLYFTLITLTTIGYGDMAPNEHYSNETFFTCIIYTVFGLAVMSTCIALVQAKVLRAIDKITRKIRKHAEL